jgi:hypothetical protein
MPFPRADEPIYVRSQLPGQQNTMVETIQLGELMVPFYSEPDESLSGQRELSAGIEAGQVQIPGRFVAAPGAVMTRYRQLMRELDAIRFVQPMRTPTPEPVARFGSAPPNLAGKVPVGPSFPALSPRPRLHRFGRSPVPSCAPRLPLLPNISLLRFEPPWSVPCDPCHLVPRQLPTDAPRRRKHPRRRRISSATASCPPRRAA